MSCCKNNLKYHLPNNTLLFFILTQAQKTGVSDIKKGTTQVLVFKYRWLLNHIRDSIKVKEDIEKAIENLKKEHE